MSPLFAVAVIGGGALLASSAVSANSLLTSDDSHSSPPLDYAGDMTGNIDAFLQVIKEGESNDDYGSLVGGGRFTDLSHHPGWTDASMTKLSSWTGWNGSHAAGAYQMQPQTFKEASDALGLGGDFSQASQDAAAVFLLKRRGAYDDIGVGNISGAVGKLTSEWQMFVTARWPVNTVVSRFQEYGGNTA